MRKEFRKEHTNSYTGNPNPLLHDLQPRHKLHSTSKVQLARLVVEQHPKIRVIMANSLFHFHDALDILELGLGSNRILASATTQTAENVPCFLLPADFN